MRSNTKADTKEAVVTCLGVEKIRCCLWKQYYDIIGIRPRQIATIAAIKEAMQTIQVNGGMKNPISTFKRAMHKDGDQILRGIAEDPMFTKRGKGAPS